MKRVPWECFLEGKSQLLWSFAACTIPAIIPGWEVWSKWAWCIIKSRENLKETMPKKKSTGHLLMATSLLSEEPKWYRSQDFYLNLIRRSLAEFFGTALFVFIGICSTRDVDLNDAYDQTPSSVTAVALGHGLGLMSMIAAFGHIR